MKAEVIFVKDRLLNELLGGIENAAQKMTRLGDVIKARTSLTWSVSLAWVILKSPAVRKHLSKAVTLNADEVREQECSPEERARITELLKLARKGHFRIMEDFATVDPSSDFAELKEMTTYLRTGAITVDRSGNTVIAKNAKELLTAYCSVVVETSKEAEFVEKVREMKQYENEMKAARQKLTEAHGELVQLTKVRTGHAAEYLSQTENAPGMREVCLSDEIRLSSDSSVWRALVTFVKPTRGEQDGPRFYNRWGIPTYDFEQVYKLTGYRPEATPALRYQYAGLYKDVPYRGYNPNLPYVEEYDDTPDGYAAFVADYKAGKLSAINKLTFEKVTI